jgi:hypothetical protein
MSLLFLLPFGTGSIYSIRKETKKPLTWGLPISLLMTTSIIHSLKPYSNIEELSRKHVKQIPASFVAAAVWQGSYFCLGHLFTKMAYPLLKDE